MFIDQAEVAFKDAHLAPQTEHVSAYCVGRTEVSVSEYAACVEAHACSAAYASPKLVYAGGEDDQRRAPFCNVNRADRATHPVNCVDWNQANAYCTWKNGRLLTAAEWEHAAARPAGTRYPWGNAPAAPDRLNACGAECVKALAKVGIDWFAMYDADDGWGGTAPVGSYPKGASAFGVLDLAGNVSEWTSEADPDGYGTRGGGWSEHSTSEGYDLLRSAMNDPSSRFDAVGMRCAYMPAPP